MNTDEVRAKFEKSFPVPKGASYYLEINRYGAGVYTEPSLTRYNSRWEGYQQATKEGEARIDRLLDSDRIEILVKDNDGFMSITKLSELDALKEADR